MKIMYVRLLYVVYRVYAAIEDSSFAKYVNKYDNIVEQIPVQSFKNKSLPLLNTVKPFQLHDIIYKINLSKFKKIINWPNLNYYINLIMII